MPRIQTEEKTYKYNLKEDQKIIFDFAKELRSFKMDFYAWAENKGIWLTNRQYLNGAIRYNRINEFADAKSKLRAYESQKRIDEQMTELVKEIKEEKNKLLNAIKLKLNGIGAEKN